MGYYSYDDEDLWDGETEDDDYYPYDDESDGYDSDDYYDCDYMADYEYYRSLANPVKRAWQDFQEWLWRTRIYRKWSDWRWSRKHNSNEELPF